MKYLKPFNEAEKIKTTEKDIPEFVEKISEMIEINWEIYDLEEDVVLKMVKKLLKKIPYIELYSPEEAHTRTELLVIYILNIGVSVANDLDQSESKNVFRYEDLIKSVGSVLKFDRIATEKLSYNGPDITSSSILATTYNIKEQMEDMEESIEKNYQIYNDNGDKIGEDNLAELKIIIGCIYQFGYGIGADRKRKIRDESRNRLHMLMSKKDKTPEEEIEYKSAFQKFMDGLK